MFVYQLLICNMGAIKIRNKLYDYIRYANDKKVRAIYTLVEDEIKQKQEMWQEIKKVKKTLKQDVPYSLKSSSKKFQQDETKQQKL
jgi:hypothetical protein